MSDYIAQEFEALNKKVNDSREANLVTGFVLGAIFGAILITLTTKGVSA